MDNEKYRLTDNEIPELSIKWEGSAIDLAFGKVTLERDVEKKFRDWITQIQDKVILKAIPLLAEEIKRGLEDLTYIDDRDLFVEIDKNEWQAFWEQLKGLIPE